MREDASASNPARREPRGDAAEAGGGSDGHSFESLAGTNRRAALVVAAQQRQVQQGQPSQPMPEGSETGGDAASSNVAPRLAEAVGEASSSGGAISSLAGAVRVETTHDDGPGGRAEIDRVFQRISTEAATLPTLEPPPTLHASLRPYQKQALYWMVYRESDAVASDAASAAWRPYALPDGTSFYLHHESGEASLSQPRATGAPRGGILADEMGLGKTRTSPDAISTLGDV